jgi:hypothetical protein
MIPDTTQVCDFVRGHTPYADHSAGVVISTGVLGHVEDDRCAISIPG